jgi:hypothetical protein
VKFARFEGTLRIGAISCQSGAMSCSSGAGKTAASKTDHSVVYTANVQRGNLAFLAPLPLNIVSDYWENIC